MHEWSVRDHKWKGENRIRMSARLTDSALENQFTALISFLSPSPQLDFTGDQVCKFFLLSSSSSSSSLSSSSSSSSFSSYSSSSSSFFFFSSLFPPVTSHCIHDELFNAFLHQRFTLPNLGLKLDISLHSCVLCVWHLDEILYFGEESYTYTHACMKKERERTTHDCRRWCWSWCVKYQKCGCIFVTLKKV